jgi:hypothetical protein
LEIAIDERILKYWYAFQIRISSLDRYL